MLIYDLADAAQNCYQIMKEEFTKISMESSKYDHAVLYYINKNELQGEPAIYDYNICWGGNQTFTEKVIHQ